MKTGTSIIILTLTVLVSCTTSTETNPFNEAYSQARSSYNLPLDSALSSVNIAVELASTPEELGKSYWLKAYIYDLNNDTENGIKYYLAAADAYIHLRDHNKASMLLENAGTSALESDAYEVALERYRERLSHAILTKDSMQVANAYYDIGLAFINSQAFDSANHYQLKVLNLVESINPDLSTTILDSTLASDAYVELGLVQYHIRNFDSARSYYTKSMLLDPSPQKDYKATLNIGNTYLEEGRLEMAKEWTYSALEKGRDIALNRTLIKPLNSLGRIYFELNIQDSAIHYFKESLALNTAGSTNANENMYLLGLFRSTRYDLGLTYEYIHKLDSSLADQLVSKVVVSNFFNYMESMKSLASLEMKRKIELANAQRDQTIMAKKIRHLERARSVNAWIKIGLIALILIITIVVIKKKKSLASELENRATASIRRMQELDS